MGYPAFKVEPILNFLWPIRAKKHHDVSSIAHFESALEAVECFVRCTF
jgi:hypothetical protein